jgi:hypothetical protein
LHQAKNTPDALSQGDGFPFQGGVIFALRPYSLVTKNSIKNLLMCQQHLKNSLA